MTEAPRAAPFPVTAPYRVRAELVRLGAAPAGSDRVDPGPATVFRDAADWCALLHERLELLEGAPERVRAVTPDAEPARLQAAAFAIAQRAAREWPERVQLERGALLFPRLRLRVAGDGSLGVIAARGAADAGAALTTMVDSDTTQRALALLSARPAALRSLDALALALDEDLVLVAAGEADEGRSEWLHVCFPSGWDPGAMAGASFGWLHAPVPGADALLKSAPALVRAMLHKGPFVRYVWGLSPDGARSRHPATARAMPANHPLDATWLRVERQTTLPLPDQRLALFAIGVHVTPLRDALAEPERRAAFVAAIDSLDAAQRRYKGVPWDAGSVRAWCEILP